MSLTFDMQSAGDCLHDFRNKIDQFDKDDLNTSLAMECAIAGWTVADWIYKCDGQRLGYKRLRDLQDEIRGQCQNLAHLQDITNARKHKEITMYAPLVKSSETRGGSFNSSFNRSFDISRLVFNTDTDQFDVWNTLQGALTYYEAYFKRNNIS